MVKEPSSADEQKKIRTLLEAKQDVEALVRKGERLIGSIKSNIKSSAESKLWFTLKIFPSNDRTLNGWDVDNIHDEMLKLAFEADDQWASAFNVHYLQLMECVERTTSINLTLTLRMFCSSKISRIAVAMMSP